MTASVTPAGFIGVLRKTGETYAAFFNTHQTSLAPHALAGTPAVKVYKDADASSEATTGLTLTAEFDSVVGLSVVAIDPSDAFYVAGHTYHVYLSAGTVNSVSVVGTVVCSFRIGTIPADIKAFTGGDTGSADDLKDFADTGYNSATHLASTTVGELGTAAKDDVKEAIQDFYDNTAYSDIGQEAFDDTPSLSYMARAGYKRLKNKVEETATQLKIYNSAGSVVDQLATVSNNGTTPSKGKIGTGP